MYNLFLRVAKKTISKIDKKYVDLIYNKIHMKYKQIYVLREAEIESRKLLERIVANIYIGITIVSIVIILATPVENKEKPFTKINDNKIEKQEFMSGEKTEYLEAKIKEGKYEKKGIYKINIEEKTPSDAQVVDRLMNVLNEELIKGENKSLSCVTTNLALLSDNDYGADVTWETGSDSINIKTGAIFRNPKGKGNEKIQLILKVAKGNVEKSKKFDLLIIEDIKTKEEQTLESAFYKLDANMKELDKNNENLDIDLPSKIGEKTVVWNNYINKEKVKDDRLLIFVLGMLVVGAIVYKGYSKIGTQIEMKKQKIELEFCEFLSKFTLLIEAGFNIKSSMSKIVKDSNKKGYLYIELRKLESDLSTGIYEIEAYDQFAKRCGSVYVNKFVSNIEEGIKKGNAGLKNALKELLRESFENRKNEAKRKGEEASTKLIFPLVIIFLAIMLIIIYPAIVSIKM